jgi:hypothetical protein
VPASNTPITAAVIAVSLLGAGTYNFIRTVQLVMLARRSRDWPWVYGKIVGSRLSIVARVRDTRFVAELRYRYTVDGREHEGERLNARPRIWGIAAEYARDNYPRGRRVKVYYNPKNPAQALLEPGLTLYLVAQLALGPTLILLGGWAAFRLIVGALTG